ncbi:endocytosis and cytoskeletal organization protein [Lineolata rhizophorae]|uniref:Endocytosis protein 3 n=1 Tax=Lineolata rhizophorae TaxID=578093 RepID=A0A6A6NWF5_9PEZI|nr:endocytosis and cytoskeletal organization protein [Lineolata rhizophorae]
MASKKIEEWEVQRYWEIFSSLVQGGTHLTGAQAATVLKNSQLRDDQLEKIWDLADVDNDGSLDFEEFCVAMRLIFDLVNGEYAEVPSTLPDWLIPESKAHLVQANRALSGQSDSFPRAPSPTDSDTPGLKDGFDWYMPPGDKAKYEEIWTANRSARGELYFDALEPLYESLDVPDTDIRSAWNLVNPQARPAIGKDAALAFLHVLAQRHEGYRIPRSVPPSLRATFNQGNIEYNVDRVGSPAGGRTAAQRWGTSSRDDATETGRKTKFGDAYLSRLGVGDRAHNRPRGTDFSGARTTEDWEEVRLKKQLRELEERIERAEKAKRGGADGSGGRRETKPALVKRELEMLLDYKRRELRKLDDSEKGGAGGGGKSLRSIREDIETVREQVQGLEAHLRSREGVLDDLKREIEVEKGGR